MREALEALAEGLRRLAESGNVRPDGEALLSGLRVSVGQLLDDEAAAAEAAASAAPAPVDVQLEALSVKVDHLAAVFSDTKDLVDQLAKLAGDLQAATVKGV